MAVITIPADGTTLTLNGTVITDFAEGDIITMTPVNPSTSQVNGVGGSVNINGRSDKDVRDMVVRVQKYSDSDTFLNTANNQSLPVSFNGSMKTNFTKDGISSSESWTLEGGSITTQPTDTKNTTDGNAMMEYTLRFRRAVRVL